MANDKITVKLSSAVYGWVKSLKREYNVFLFFFSSFLFFLVTNSGLHLLQLQHYQMICVCKLINWMKVQSVLEKAAFDECCARL